MGMAIQTSRKALPISAVASKTPRRAFSKLERPSWRLGRRCRNRQRPSRHIPGHRRNRQPPPRRFPGHDGLSLIQGGGTRAVNYRPRHLPAIIDRNIHPAMNWLLSTTCVSFGADVRASQSAGKRECLNLRCLCRRRSTRQVLFLRNNPSP